MKILIMAEETLEKIAFLNQKHEELLAKRESLLELQKTKELNIVSRYFLIKNSPFLAYFLGLK